MNKLNLIIVLTFLCFSIKLISQDIITDVYMSYSYISLGEEVTIEFDVNLLRDCDSYSVDVEIDYLLNDITILVDYDYDEDCEESSSSYTEEVVFLPLLEGTYNVTIECDVAFDFFLDEEVDLWDLNVDKPDSDDCDASFVPYISEFCPFWGEEVCACDGKNYDNECEAYFEEEHGIYHHFNCGDHVIDNSILFECGNYSLDIENTFVDYDCNISSMYGSELYFEYQYDNSNDTLLIYFESISPDVKLFLIDIDASGINCIAASEGSKLEVTNLPKGNYYIIADSDFGNSSDIEICDLSSNVDLFDQNQLSIFPNPNNSKFAIKSENNIQKVKIFDILGNEKYFVEPNQKEINISQNFQHGIYFIEIESKHELVIKKMLIK
ncbi:MAG: T9SS type A sorting domain-containing protein [Saprospiraceae bacterium]